MRLTMGGEPTFVSADGHDRAGMEHRRRRRRQARPGRRLAQALAEHYAPSGVVHYGQGKWYPGEPLPRWQIAITWRNDGEPLWTRRDLLASPWADAESRRRRAGRALAGALAASIAARLGIEADFVLPAYEDRLAQLVTETQLPVGDVPETDVESAGPRGDRARLVAELDADTGEPVGWVLPLHRSEDGDALVDQPVAHPPRPDRADRRHLAARHAAAARLDRLAARPGPARSVAVRAATGRCRPVGRCDRCGRPSRQSSSIPRTPRRPR